MGGCCLRMALCSQFRPSLQSYKVDRSYRVHTFGLQMLAARVVRRPHPSFFMADAFNLLVLDWRAQKTKPPAPGVGAESVVHGEAASRDVHIDSSNS